MGDSAALRGRRRHSPRVSVFGAFGRKASGGPSGGSQNLLGMGVPREPGGQAARGSSPLQPPQVLCPQMGFVEMGWEHSLAVQPGCGDKRLLLRQEVSFSLQSSHKMAQRCSTAEFNFTVQLGP